MKITTPSLYILLLSLFLSACGGGGGGNSSPQEPAVIRTLNLGAPSANPSVLPPSASVTRVTFLSVASGTAHPEQLILDELDKNGQVINSDIARLADDGEGVDQHQGDRIYSGSILISSAVSSERFYRVRGRYNLNDTAISGTGNFWISGCPAQARPSNPALAVMDTNSDALIYSNEVTITVNDGITPDISVINELITDVGAEVVGCIPALRQYLLEFTGDGTANGVHEIAQALEAKPEIISAGANAQTLELPGDNGKHCDGQECQWYLERIRAPEAWAISGGGSDQMSVAVIDFGVDCTHPELKCDGNVYQEDTIDHGTAVAGLIAARQTDGTDLVGVAWNSALYPYNFKGPNGSQYKMSELIISSLKEDSIKIINISAATVSDNNEQLKEAICTAIDSGRLVVVAAGNTHNANCEQDNVFPAKYNSVGTCSNGADLQSGLLVVGASDENNALARWGDDSCSNTRHVDLFAPGKNMYTASAVTNYSSRDGTSYSTPIASGSAAVLWSSHPELTVSEVHDLLVISASTLSTDTENLRAKTTETQMENQPLLDLYTAVGGNDIVAPDTSPDDFNFNNRSNAIPRSRVNSNAVTISGIDTSTPISVLNGFYSIDGGPFTSAAGAIRNGQQLRLQIIAEGTPGRSRTATVTVGDVTKTYTVTTSPDTDQDGLTDAEEAVAGTSPTTTDTDFDGMSDYFEVKNNLQPLTHSANVDTDNDGLTDLQEYQFGSDPRDQDTDKDGIIDGEDPEPTLNVAVLVPIWHILM